MPYFIGFLIGVVLGGFIVLIVSRLQRRETENAFASLSQNALKKNTEDFLQLANQALSTQTQTGTIELEGKKQLIDQTLQLMKKDLDNVEKMINDTEKMRIQTFTEISSSLKAAADQTGKLQDTTNKLQAALANTRVRGQWGERMAEDILRLLGFEEGLNYTRQKSLEVGTRPDFAFSLPPDLILNMDVKFPLDCYLKYMNEDNETIKDAHRRQFLKDVRQRIKEVTTRDYINPAERTVDYVLIFVPSEQIYCFIHENDKEIMDEALKNKVILCSPLTLYALLAVIRQQANNFKLEKTASQVLALFGTFNKQWNEYKKCTELLGAKIQQAYEEYEALSTTRSRMLERPLKQIDELRKQRGILEQPLVEDIGGSEENELKPGCLKKN